MVKPKKIKKSDYSRVLVTETIPYETPIIFSNNGFYSNARADLSKIANEVERTLLGCFITGEKVSKAHHSTVPFFYKIKKSSASLRRLSLVHPASQWRACTFYQKYEELLLHYCSLSPFSIRAPSKVASSYYSKSNWENIHKYKSGIVSEDITDKQTKNSPSFFAYKGYNRLYKFFESRDYLKLEKRYKLFWSLDVSKCFDSIYTHCLSWATKDKKFTKRNVSVDSTFAQEFDALMRHMNHSETHGIVIGPEISRIFAEIIFQQVEVQLIKKLELKGLNPGSDYTIRRYVDDIFIFSNDEICIATVAQFYEDELNNYNLQINHNKTDRLRRPFYTKKSKISKECSTTINAFLEKFTEEVGSTKLKPKKIHDPWRLAKSVIDELKGILAENQSDYDAIANYLIPVLNERIKKLIDSDEELDENSERDYRDTFLVILDLQFFLYEVAPSVSASYKLSTSIILALRFFRSNVKTYYETISQKIYELTEELLSADSFRHSNQVEGFISLETVNIILAARELGDDYLLTEKTIREVFVTGGLCNYFDIVCGLFYVQNDPKYIKVKKEILKIADTLLHDMTDIFWNAEKTHLFLDMLSCPYVYTPLKKAWLTKFYKEAAGPHASLPGPAKSEIDNFIAAEHNWFINWKDLDLLNHLERKELSEVY